MSNQSPSGRDNLDSYRRILSVGIPLVLSSTGLMIMYMIDAICLAWYSEEAIAAAVPAGLMTHILAGLFLGIGGYTSVFVAQFVGAGHDDRVGAVVWQGIWFALTAGIVLALSSFAADSIFNWMGHAESIRALEIQYFKIACWGGPLIVLAGTLPGFFAGRGATATLMVVELFGFTINAVLDYVLIFGRLGFSEWGVAGAAAATVVAQGVVALILIILILRPSNRRQYNTSSAWRLDLSLLRRLLRFGAPNGFRLAMEIAAWTIFMVCLGRIGIAEQTVSNIVWRINGLAFFPMFGLAQAVSVLVGQAQGQKRPDLAARCAWRGLLLCEVWMLGCAALYLLLPETFLGLFYNPDRMSPERFDELTVVGTILLRFVALYCVLDAFNMILVYALSGAGDTRWTFIVSSIAHLLFVAAILWIDHVHRNIYAIWIAATTFVMLQSFVWLARFLSGRWRDMQVIEIDLTAG
jgi:MATE family multidrug resistance protein